ncbi:MAG: transcriptional regulator [Clostridia bacterium]|nr:transcriptional regulator [Clostridia bacterium]
MNMQFLPFIIGVIVLFIILKILSMPMKLIIKFLVNALIGGVVLYVLNLFGVGIVINWITALIVGFLGIPGVIIVAILQFVLHVI